MNPYLVKLLEEAGEFTANYNHEAWLDKQIKTARDHYECQRENADAILALIPQLPRDIVPTLEIREGRIYIGETPVFIRTEGAGKNTKVKNYAIDESPHYREFHDYRLALNYYKLTYLSVLTATRTLATDGAKTTKGGQDEF